MAGNIGRSKPDALANKPRINPGNELFYSAYLALDGERQIGMGTIGPIPWSAQAMYCHRWGWDTEQELALNYVVANLDAAKLKHMNDTAKR